MSHDKSLLEILARVAEIGKNFTATEKNSVSIWGKNDILHRQRSEAQSWQGITKR